MFSRSRYRRGKFLARDWRREKKESIGPREKLSESTKDSSFIFASCDSRQVFPMRCTRGFSTCNKRSGINRFDQRRYQVAVNLSHIIRKQTKFVIFCEENLYLFYSSRGKFLKPKILHNVKPQKGKIFHNKFFKALPRSSTLLYYYFFGNLFLNFTSFIF